MRRLPVALIPLSVPLILAACGDRTTSSRLAAPEQPLAVSSTSACNFTTMKSDAKIYLSNQDSSLSVITDMSQQYGKGNLTASDLDGWKLLKIVAHERLSSAQHGTSDDGARYVGDVLNCISTVPQPLDTAFTNHASNVLALGIFEVRGDVGGITLPAWAWLSVSGARAAASPAWGVEPVGGTWPTTDGTFLLYAYPKNVGPVIPGPSIDGTYNAFELGTVPLIGLKTGYRVGVCVSADVISGVANRLLHNGAIQPNDSPQTLCSSAPTFASNSTGTGVRAWFASLFKATPLYAQGLLLSVGGTPDGWSPFGTGALTVSQIALAFTTQPPPTTFVDTLFTVVVKATYRGTDNSINPVPGVDVTVQVANNSGTPAGAFINGGNPTHTTGPDGTASFTISVHKAGGYTLLATGAIGTTATQSGLSNQFQVQNK